MKAFKILSLAGFILLFSAAAAAAADETNVCSQDKAEKLRLLKKAEKEQFNIKFIEISGNTYTRYITFSEHWEKDFNEGGIFKIETLMKSIKGLNKIKSIRPIGLENIAVRLEENDRSGWSSINFLICVEQLEK